MYQCCSDTYAVGQWNVLKAWTVVGKHTQTLIQVDFMHHHKSTISCSFKKWRCANIEQMLSTISDNTAFESIAKSSAHFHWKQQKVVFGEKLTLDWQENFCCYSKFIFKNFWLLWPSFTQWLCLKILMTLCIYLPFYVYRPDHTVE